MLNDYINSVISNLPKNVGVSSIIVNAKGTELLNKLTTGEVQTEKIERGFVVKYIGIPVKLDTKQESLFAIAYDICK